LCSTKKKAPSSSLLGVYFAKTDLNETRLGMGMGMGMGKRPSDESPLETDRRDFKKHRPESYERPSRNEEHEFKLNLIPCRTLFVSNLSPAWQKDVDALFRTIPGFKKIVVGPTGVYAFAEFEDVDSATNTIKTYDKYQLGSILLRMNYAKKDIL